MKPLLAINFELTISTKYYCLVSLRVMYPG